MIHKAEHADAYPRPLVSVVMPVRNQERVLRETLESVFSQTLRNFELVLVDDGSSDGSLAIEKEFESRDHRVRLLQRSSEGVGPARNFGLGVASGRYVIFLDSDDLFHPDLLLDMASILEATGVDICICETDFFYGSESAAKPYWRFGSYKEGLYHKHAFGRATFQVGCDGAYNKMCRREFLLDSGALFYDATHAEDAPFSYKAMWEADSVYLLKKSLVRYRRGLGTSISDKAHEHPYEPIQVAEKAFVDIAEPDAFSKSEAASLRLACANLLLMAVSDLVAVGKYTEEVHESVGATLRYWGSPGMPRTRAELGTALKTALVKHASCDKVIWAHARWAQKSSRHTSLEKLGFASRIAVAIASSNLPVPGGK